MVNFFPVRVGNCFFGKMDYVVLYVEIPVYSFHFQSETVTDKILKISSFTV